MDSTQCRQTNNRNSNSVSSSLSNHLPVGHPNQKQNQQPISNFMDPVKISDFFEILGKIGGQEISNNNGFEMGTGLRMP